MCAPFPACCVGADISDYFNYGFSEETWKLYCEKQRKMRGEVNHLNKIAVSTTTPSAPSSLRYSSSNSYSQYSHCSPARVAVSQCVVAIDNNDDVIHSIKVHVMNGGMSFCFFIVRCINLAVVKDKLSMLEIESDCFGMWVSIFGYKARIDWSVLRKHGKLLTAHRTGEKDPRYYCTEALLL